MHRPIAPSADSPVVPAAAPLVAVDYPSSDGKPLAENDLQAHAILYAFGALRLRYRDRRPDVYVSADLLIYYEEGNSRVSVAPDVFVVFGVEDHARMHYKVWEEGKGPDFVLEVASPNTWQEDVERKPGIYAGLGVSEYFLFDPTEEHLSPRLQGYRLVGGGYEPLMAVESIDRTLTLTSEVLGLELRAKGEEMRFHDPATDEDLLSHDEEHTARRAAEARAEAEAAARREEVAAREKEAAARQAAEPQAGREAVARREEAAARRAAEARIAELEARLSERR